VYKRQSEYALPSFYPYAKITTLPYTTINSTHWRWVFRCQNCTSTHRCCSPAYIRI
jgi:hypothetical protein